jgi:UDP-N-acetylglucosamine 2-epimerase (non-hydrolysing)
MAFTVHLVAGARPNFMKVAPLWHALRHAPWCRPLLVHTGQHSDPAMSDAFMADLDLPAPDIALGIAGTGHAETTGRTMMAYEAVLSEARPGLTVVVGDVNATLACALAATKLGVTVAHLEAGLRSFDRAMPEEINRLATDAICDRLWTPSQDASEQLAREGHPASRIACVGNAMIDSLEMILPRARAEPLPEGLEPGGYGVVTLHRPSNVDDTAALAALCAVLEEAAQQLPLVFPVHPRTRARLEGRAPRGVALLPPLPYRAFIGLLCRARLAITDSGGLQEETSHLGIPCLTLRANTERPVTITLGTNRLVAPDAVPDSVAQVLRGAWPKGSRIPLWDGQTGARVRQEIQRLAGG